MIYLIFTVSLLLSFIAGIYVGRKNSDKLTEFVGMATVYKWEIVYRSWKFEKQEIVFAATEEEAIRKFYNKCFLYDEIYSIKQI